MIGLLTDSSAQLPAALCSRHAVEVVPIPISIGDRAYLEGVDLDADGFFEGLTSGAAVHTSQPSPGQFLDSYRRLAAAGAEEVVAVLVGSAFSGTLNSARVAATDSPVPVSLVDSGTLSFGIACCVLEAAAVIESGGRAAQAAAAARLTAEQVATTFIVQPGAVSARVTQVHVPWVGEAMPVMLMAKDRLEEIGRGVTVDEICDLLVAPMLAERGPIRAAVSIADDSAKDFWVGMEQRLAAAPNVAELITYRVGPSVAAQTGPGTAGGYWHRLRK